MKKILIINSNYYKSISNNLFNNSKKKLSSKKYSISKIDVPGIFEIPIIIRKNIKKFDAFVALGCVIKGQTPHFDLICNSTFNAILQLSINFNKPIGNGIITALTMRQAINRSKKSSLKTPNKGSEAAYAVISVLKNEPKKI
jgi:6,7-dimethyl-8-ribityllumazine synthase